MNSKLIFCQTEGDFIKTDTTFENDTVLLSIDQMAELFQCDESIFFRLIKDILNEGELIRNSVVTNFATTASDKKDYRTEDVAQSILARHIKAFEDLTK